MYGLLRPLLFLLSPERAHRATFSLLDLVARTPFLLRLIGARPPAPAAAVEVMGIRFPSPVGLAAGMDKDAAHVESLAAMGFGHIEVGTLTPRPQPGNPMPRLFRLKRDRALINRMGFNNAGAAAAAERLRERRTPGIVIGGNIGKNKDTPNERAVDDYETCFRTLHPVVDYFVVNVSSPNTPGLRDLQEKEPLLGLLERLQAINRQAVGGMKPILLKIAPDLSEGQLNDVVDVVKQSGIAGVVATNTTIARDGLTMPAGELRAIGAGGLSGTPLRARSTAMIRHLRLRLPRPFTIIGVGGIDSPEAAVEKFEAGADLVQVYTGLVYEGPALVHGINEAFARWKR